MITKYVEYSNVSADAQVFVVHHGIPPEDRVDVPFLVVPEPLQSDYDPRWTYLVTPKALNRPDSSVKVIVISGLPPLDDGDIILYRRDVALVELIYQVQSETNALFLTSNCNSRCFFCPQPPKKDNEEFYDLALQVIRYATPKGDSIGITGGEPTLNRRRFLDVLSTMAEWWPSIKPLVLTNGRALADAEFMRRIFDIRTPENIGFCVPLYADAAALHDRIVGVRGAFGQTIRGVYNLAPYHLELELRFVVSKLNYQRLPKLVEFVGLNLPFISRLAVIGIEPMGHSRTNWSEVWIDPEETAPYLLQASRIADRMGIQMLLYNHQLCCIPPELHAIACSSISEWKRVYIEACQSCPMRSNCGGFFASQDAPKYRPKHFEV